MRFLQDVFTIGLLALCMLITPLTASAYHLEDNLIKHMHRGDTYLQQGNPQAAIDEYRIALALEPTASISASLFHNLARAYRQLGMHDVAISALQRSMRLQPQFERYFRDLLATYDEKGQTEKAITYLEHIVQDINPDDTELWYLLGLLYMQQSQLAQAQGAFATYQKKAPSSPLAQVAENYALVLGEGRNPLKTGLIPSVESPFAPQRP